MENSVFYTLIWLLPFLMVNPLRAETSSPKQALQIAVVQDEGATVYSKADFDSAVLIQLKPGQKVRVTRQVFPGPGGFGSFYKAIFKNNRFGYIADTEVIPEYQQTSKGKREKRNPNFDEAQSPHQEREPIYFTRYIGGVFGQANFTEKFGGTKLGAETPVYGLKITGPDLLFDSPPIDFNLLFHWGVPSYYSSILTGPASGFFIMADALLIFSVLETSNNLLTVGAGPLLIYTDFKLNVVNTYFDSQEIRLGASMAVAYTRRFGRFAARLEGKYYFEKTQYFGYSAGMQVEF